MTKSTFRAPPSSEFWAKCMLFVCRSKAHLWIPLAGARNARSRCGMFMPANDLLVADENTTRCKRCEKQ